MEKYSQFSRDHLLRQESEDGDSVGFAMPHRPRGTLRAWLGGNIFGLISSLLLFYIAIVSTINLAATWNSEHTTHSVLSNEYHALPDLHIEFEERLEWVDPRPHPWNLEPSDELDSAWEDLLYGLNVRISPDEMDLINETKTNRVLVTGGDYAAAMGIWHELHCINNLRKLIHWDDYYGPKYDGTEDPEAFGKAHSDHCLDMIRQSLMCRPDTSIYPFHWGEDGIPSNHVKSKTPTTCVRWDSLDNWASKRALRPGEYSYVREHHS
ncbi:hypothetical protein GGR56DRAFT_625922 [Xylariaceae sp. FL0804]|nr:hypothetical protein GGR56DRAFT_625922 [Xylariaceae sp. FL0804]